MSRQNYMLSNNLPSVAFGTLLYFTMQAPSVTPSPQISPLVIDILKAVATLFATYVFHKIQKRYAGRLRQNEKALAQTKSEISDEIAILRGQMAGLSRNLEAESIARTKAEELNDAYEIDNASLRDENEKLVGLLEASNRGLSSMAMYVDELDEHIDQLKLQLAERHGAEQLAKELADIFEKRFPPALTAEFAQTVDRIRGYAETLNLNKARQTQQMSIVKGEDNATS